MATCDINRICDGALAYLQSIDMPTEVAVLAAARTSDTTYTASATANPDWDVDGGVMDVHESLLPAIRLDLLDWPHQDAQKSGDNYAQYWRLQMVITVATRGSSRTDAERRAKDAVSVLVAKWLGSGAQMGMDRAATGLVTSWLTGGGWNTQRRNDQFYTVANLLLTIEYKVTLPRS